MGFKKPPIRLKVTWFWKILHQTPDYYMSHLPSGVAYHHRCSGKLVTNGSSVEIAILTLLVGLCGTQTCLEDNLQSADNSAPTATGYVSRSGKQTNEYAHPHRYSEFALLQPFPCASHFYHHLPLNMTHSVQASNYATQAYQSYGPHC